MSKNSDQPNQLFEFWIKENLKIKDVEGSLKYINDPDYEESLKLLQEYERALGKK